MAWGVNAVFFCTLVALYELSRLFTGWRHAVSPRRIWPAIAALAIVVAWCLVQVSTWVPVTYQHPIWQMARDTLELNIAGSISVNRDATVVALMRLMTSAAALWLSLQLCRSSHRARRLVQAIALIGLLYAIYGIVAFFVFPKTILWFEKQYYLESLTSTFINRNSYATYAAVGFLSAVALVFSAFQMNPASPDAKRRVAEVLVLLVGSAGAWLGVAMVIALALILTGSRGGITAGLLGLVTGIIISSLQRRGQRSGAPLGAVLAALAFVSVALTFGELLAARLNLLGFQSDDRLAVFALTWTSIMDKPFLGFGYGTFEHVFPMYRDATVSPVGTWDKAHNTYLEVLQGLGLPVATILMLGVGALVWRGFLGALTRRQALTAPLAASAATVTVLSHAFADFSLQMQGVTLTWVALLGAGVAQSWSRDVDTTR